MGTYLLLAAAQFAAAEGDPREELSRGIAARFQQDLGQQLMSSLAENGPAGSIGICSEAAPAIAARLSGESGARVSRTALRTRNPGNAADANARSVMEQFAARLQAGKSPDTLHDYAANDDGSARYMRAIVTQPLCLTCHGDDIAPEIRAEIARRYPEDQATGFHAGELRGAFLVDWPAGERAR